MAIALASGKSGFDGNFNPIMYSKQAQIALRKASVISAITTTPTLERLQIKGMLYASKKSLT